MNYLKLTIKPMIFKFENLVYILNQYLIIINISNL